MPAKIEINPGDRYGRLTIINEIESHITPNGDIKRKALCQCDCGNQTSVRMNDIRSGRTTSCGCFLLNQIVKANTKHGLTFTKEYRIWSQMIQRCTNPNAPNYKYYGGRGITVCERWLKSFKNFYADMGPKPGPEYSIDRIDVNGNYEPSNCRWATPIEQANNKRNNR